MAKADNALLVQEHIQLLQAAAAKVVELQEFLYKVQEEQQTVNQTWSSLPTDFPTDFYEAGVTHVGTGPPDVNTQIKLGTVVQPFTADILQKVKNHVDQLMQALDGEAMGGGNVNRARNFRKLAR